MWFIFIASFEYKFYSFQYCFLQFSISNFSCLYLEEISSRQLTKLENYREQGKLSFPIYQQLDIYLHLSPMKQIQKTQLLNGMFFVKEVYQIVMNFTKYTREKSENWNLIRKFKKFNPLTTYFVIMVFLRVVTFYKRKFYY